MAEPASKDLIRFRETHRAADAGDGNAQFNLGLMYANGVGTEQDFGKAMFWYHKAAEKGVPAAQYILAGKYANGQGVNQDFRQALSWYLKASDHGYPRATFRLGELLAEPHAQFADECFRRAADKGLPEAQVVVAERLVAKEKEQGGDTAASDKALALYLKAAESGAANAQYVVGTYCESGKLGGEPDLAQAIAWYRKAARQGLAAAQSRLGAMYAHGEGVAKDNRQAFSWFSRAAEQGDADAQYQLAVMLENGSGVDADPQQAESWLLKAAEQGVVEAQRRIAQRCESDSSDEEAACWYRLAAERGDAQAMLVLGGMYAEGRGVEQSFERALSCLLAAAEQGEPAAYLALAEWVDREGLNMTTAWYRQAAGHAVVDAQYELANRLMRGRGTAADQFEASNWYLKAADAGLAEAEFALGEIFLAKSPDPDSAAEAAAWFRAAAKKGFAPAQAALAALYAQGIAVPKDYKQAAAWWQKAAEQGNVEAQYQLGQLFERGLSGPVARNHAEHWYRRALDQGNDERALLALAAMLRKSGRDEAEKLLREAAGRNVADAQYALADLLYEKAQRKLTAEALPFWLQAAGQGLPPALARLAEFARSGELAALLSTVSGIPAAAPAEKPQAKTPARKERPAETPRPPPPDRSEHARILAEADRGEPAALWTLGTWHLRGEHGLARSLETANACFRKAAQAGFAAAQAALAVMLSSGQGCAQDSKQAAFWWAKAAEQGDVESQYNLGLMYEKGVGVDPDIVQAAAWIRKAAEQGIVIAQIRLGLFHATARLGAADLVEAYAWFAVAARSGSEAALANREHAESMMTAQALREGRRRADGIVRQIDENQRRPTPAGTTR